MREQLIRYIDLLFAGATDAYDIKQEILQNTLDRYDDLIAQGKAPEAAYSLAITGIGDIGEILSRPSEGASVGATEVKRDIQKETDTIQVRKMRAVAIAMYILCPIPLFILSEFGRDTIGLCFTLLLVAAATALISLSKKGLYSNADFRGQDRANTVYDPNRELRNSIKSIMNTLTICGYLIVSLITHAWFVTWIIFPLMGAIRGLIFACMDLKEVKEYEN